VLEVLERFNHPVGITTKNALIVRDADILGRMGKAGLAMASMSITTLDRKLARAMEPRASTPERRFEAVRAMTDAGLPMMVGFAPIIPGLNDHEMEAVLQRAAEAGAVHASFTVLRLPLEIKDLFREWLAAERPQRASKVMSMVRQMRGGKDYDSDWGTRMKGEGPIAELLAARFKAACKRYGLNLERVTLDTARFAIPPKSGDQLPLF
jgi:DNA repair photolyase